MRGTSLDPNPWTSADPQSPGQMLKVGKDFSYFETQRITGRFDPIPHPL